MNKTLFCGVDLHSNNAMYVVTDQQDKPLFQRRLPNRLPVVLESLEPFRRQLKVVAGLCQVAAQQISALPTTHLPPFGRPPSDGVFPHGGGEYVPERSAA